MNSTTKTAARDEKSDEKYEGFTAEERAAMKDRATELKAASRRGSRTAKGAKADGESDLLAKLAEMTESDRAIGEGIHAIVKAAAPELTSTTWYGMPAYAKDGKILCFFQCAQKFKMRYAMLGFSDKANLDDGAMWPVYYALPEMTPAAEKKISALIKKAAS